MDHGVASFDDILATEQLFVAFCSISSQIYASNATLFLQIVLQVRSCSYIFYETLRSMKRQATSNTAIYFMTDKFQKPTEAELEILQMLWNHGSLTVRDINTFLASKRDVGYTTTLKMLQIMHEKGLVVRDETARSHVYEAAVTELDTRAHLLDSFLETAFGGSSASMVMQALGRRQPSRTELDQIRKLLDDMEGGES
jgi:BlaI family transcriptional regulator, penicillinase repressor